MKFDLSDVRYSKRDLEKGIKIPTKLSEDLAEDLGIHMGDGGLHYCNSRKSSLMFSYSGHLLEKKYMNYIVELKKKLYNIKKVKWYLYGNELRIRFCSIAIATFYSDVLGIPTGSKKDFAIPSVIKECKNKKIIASYLRGIIDTDFCLIVRTKYGKKYPSLVGGFANKEMVFALGDLFKKLGIEYYIEEDRKSFHKKVGKYYVTSKINLNGYKRVHKWLKLISYRNSKYDKKIRKMGPA